VADEKRYYFAYGSDIAKKQMASRCPGSQLAGRAQLLAHSFLITERGVASVAPARRPHHGGVHLRALAGGPKGD
jgi:hypothetical protein